MFSPIKNAFSNIRIKIGRWLGPGGRFFLRCSNHVGSNTPQPKQELGLAGEQAAARYLQSLGYRIIAHSHRQRLGEIDLIAVDGQCVVFVEVKTWSSDVDGDPSLAVDRRKQERLSRAALIYLKRHHLLEQPCRFDVVSIVWPTDRSSQRRVKPSIRHFMNAFEAIGSGQFFR